MSQRLVITVTHNQTQDLASVAFTVANAALSKGMQVGVFLTSDGVELARDGAAHLSHFRPFKQLDELIEGFVANGGTVWACAPCFQGHGLEVERTVEGTEVTGAGPMLSWIAEGAATLSF